MIYILFLYEAYAKGTLKSTFELPIIILLSLFSGIIMFYTKDIFLWILALELQSFCFYALAGFRDSYSFLRTNAGIQYFIFGTIASACILLGLSFVYLSTGFTDLNSVALVISFNGPYFTPQLGVTLVIFGISLKLGMPPAHKWMPTVYSETSKIITFFFITIPKIPLLYLLFSFAFLDSLVLMDDVAVLGGLIIGTLVAFKSTQLGNFFAYSAIANNAFFFSVAFRYWGAKNINCNIIHNYI